MEVRGQRGEVRVRVRDRDRYRVRLSRRHRGTEARRGRSSSWSWSSGCGGLDANEVRFWSARTFRYRFYGGEAERGKGGVVVLGDALMGTPTQH